MIQKHAIPILEFDDNPSCGYHAQSRGAGTCTCQRSVSMLFRRGDWPLREGSRGGLCRRIPFLPPRPIQSTSWATRARRSVWLRLLLVQLQQPSLWIGWLAMGVEQIISTGTCGVLADIEENAFLVPVRLLRDEGASYHYGTFSLYGNSARGYCCYWASVGPKGFPMKKSWPGRQTVFTEKRLKRWLIARKKAVLLWRWSVLRLQQ